MKRISFLMMTLALCAGPAVRAQDAATEERLNQLSGQIEDIRANEESLKSRIADLTREVAALREKAGQPTGNYAGAEDLKRVADAVKEVDSKRMEDYKTIMAALKSLENALLKTPTPTGGRKGGGTSPGGGSTTPAGASFQGDKYTIKSGDTPSGIAASYYKEKGVRITSEQILNANPGLKEKNLPVGKEIIIPAPQPRNP